MPNSINMATVDSIGVENTMNLLRISMTVNTDSLVKRSKHENIIHTPKIPQITSWQTNLGLEFLYAV